MKFLRVYTKNDHNNYQFTTKQQDCEGELRSGEGQLHHPYSSPFPAVKI